MKRVMTLACVVVLVAVACSSTDGDGTTTTAPAGNNTTTSVAEDPEEAIGPSLFIVEIDPAIQGAQIVGTTIVPSTVTRLDQGSVVDASDTFEAQTGVFVPPTNPSAGFADYPGIHGCRISTKHIFVHAEQIAVYDFLVGTPVDVPATYEVDDSLPSDGTTPFNDFVLVNLNEGVDPIEAVAAILADGGAAAPEYWFASSPRWRYGPGTVPITPGPALPQQAIESMAPTKVRVLDFFGQSNDLAESHHGDFVVGILTALGVPTESRHVGTNIGGGGTSEAVVVGMLASGELSNVSFGGHECSVIEGSSWTWSDGTTTRQVSIPDDINGNKTLGEILPLPPIMIPASQFGGLNAELVAAAGNDANDEDGEACHAEIFPARYASFAWPPDAQGQADTLVEGIVQNFQAKQDADLGWIKLPGVIDTSLWAAMSWYDILPPSIKDYYTGGEGGTPIHETVTSAGALAPTAVDDQTTEFTAAAKFSNCGPETVWAPGVGIVSKYGAETAIWGGTSFAAPVVAASKAGSPGF